MNIFSVLSGQIAINFFFWLSFFLQELQPSLMHMHSFVLFTDFLFLSYPFIVETSSNRLFLLGLQHFSSSSALASHMLAGLELAMTSSVVEFFFEELGSRLYDVMCNVS